MAGRFSIEAMFKGNDSVSKTISQVEGRIGRMSTNVAGSLRDIDKANSKIVSGFTDLAKQAAVVGAVVGGALAAGLHHVIEAGAGFEQSITNVGAVMGKNRGQIQELEKEAMRLGVVTQFSSSEVAEAMEFMARKGFDSGEILAGIPGILNAVAASGQGMAEVATVVGSSIRGFGLEAAQAGRVANILAFVAEKTGATITDLGTALAVAAPTAKTLGVSIEDTATAVGLLQKVGLDASTAGSSVATMLAKISKPSSEIAAKMTSLGVKFKDAKGNMLPFRDVLGQFVKVGSKVGGNMDRMAFFAELVGLRGDKAALALADMAKSGDFDKLAKGVQNVGDYAERVAKIRLDTTQGSWKLLTSTVEVLETKLFNLKSGALRGIIDSTNAWLGANQELIVSKFGEFIANAAWALQLFGHGASEGFGIASSMLTAFLAPLRLLANLMGLSQPWPGTVENLGRAFGFVTVAAVAFGGFVLAVKAARAAMIAYEAAVWLTNTAVGVYSFVTGGSAIVTGVNTAAMYAGRAAAVAIRIAQIAYNAALVIGALATGRITLATVASKIATMASTAWTWLLNIAEKARTATFVLGELATVAYTGAMVTSTEATVATTGAVDAANLSMGAFVITLGAALAAVGALYKAYVEFKKLEDVSGGWEGVKAGIGGALAGEGYAKGVDDYQNTQARDEADAAGGPAPPTPQVASPYSNPYLSAGGDDGGGGPAPYYGEITVRTAPGTSAAVTQKPKGPHRLNLAPSGTP